MMLKKKQFLNGVCMMLAGGMLISPLYASNLGEEVDALIRRIRSCTQGVTLPAAVTEEEQDRIVEWVRIPPAERGTLSLTDSIHYIGNQELIDDTNTSFKVKAQQSISPVNSSNPQWELVITGENSALGSSRTSFTGEIPAIIKEKIRIFNDENRETRELTQFTGTLWGCIKFTVEKDFGVTPYSLVRTEDAVEKENLSEGWKQYEGTTVYKRGDETELKLPNQKYQLKIEVKETHTPSVRCENFEEFTQWQNKIRHKKIEIDTTEKVTTTWQRANAEDQAKIIHEDKKQSSQENRASGDSCECANPSNCKSVGSKGVFGGLLNLFKK